MQNMDQAKVESVATSYSEYLESGYTAEQSESLIRELAPDNGCDSSQIERGIKLGQSWCSDGKAMSASYTITNDNNGSLIARDNESGEVVCKVPSNTVIASSKDAYSVVDEFGSALVGDVQSVEHDGEYIHVTVRIPAAIGINHEDVN